MAIYQNKHIIPVFVNINDVPNIIRIETGVNALNKDYNFITQEINPN